MTRKDKWCVSSVFAVAFIAFAGWLFVKEGRFVPVAEYKYPAQLYYLSYAIPIAFLLFALLPKLDQYPVSGLTRFVSRSSLWIYLWHMLTLYAVKMVIEDNTLWWLQYIVIMTISVFVVWVQNWIVDFLQMKTHWNWLKIFKG